MGDAQGPAGGEPGDAPAQGAWEEHRPPAKRSREARLVATGAALVLLLWFALANLQKVHIRFWVASTSAPLVVVVAVSAFLGAAAAGIGSWAVRRRRSGSEGAP